MNKYDQFKDSEIESLPLIASQWRLIPLKYFADVTLGKMLTPVASEGFCLKPYLRSQNIQIDNVNVTDIKEMWFSPSDLKKYRLQKDDILVNEGGDIGRTSLWRGELEECYIQNSVNRVRILNGNSKYYLYHFFLFHQRGYFDSIVNRVSIPHLTKEKLEAVKFVHPPVHDQIQIARYLDHKTAQIDKLISDKEKLIELLNEERTAIVNQAVTKGINPKAPMKDSGIEWLGEIPQHWEVKKINYVADVTKLTGFEYTNKWHLEENGEIIALKGYNIQNGFLDLTKIEKISSTLSSELFRSKLFKNDIVYPCTGSIGNAYLIEEDDKYHINQNIAKITPNRFILPQYLLDCLLSESVKSQIHYNNTSSMQPVILIGELRQIKIAHPPMIEQIEISNWIKNFNKTFQNISIQVKQEISLLKEYKTALISEVVTGKVDVRNEVIAESGALATVL